ncbi:unnamed protein product [Thlaspi arvense]|uniref:Cytochrome P450 n=1 Tax=Thlaspi arvense TaxID=13288 RepID=A0AAU9SDY9_THLAR|nr:unnamed protein product [Thlaspi arvense]
MGERSLYLNGVSWDDVFLAGVNAGVITMIWTMTELTRHPRVMKKLQEEIRITLGSNKERITEEDLEKVEYLKLVIEETFRLHPPAPLLLPRLAMADIKIQGYNIPKNTVIQLGLLNLLYFFNWSLPIGMTIADIDMDEFGSLNIAKKVPLELDVVLAGVNAGVTTMIWLMTELIRHPRVMKKLQDEIRTTLGPNKERITEEELEKVEYMKLVIKETFRLHPPAPLLLPRQTTSDIEIQGYNIPKNTMIKINTYTIGRDPECWTNPEEFVPERFSNNSINYKGQHFELLPFGAGRRSCPGMALGITILELGLLNVLYFFDWSLPNGMTIEDIDMEEAGSLNIAKKVPLELVPSLHHSS